MTVKKETAQIRPFVVCAILRNVTFDQDRYDAWAVGAVDGISEGGSGHHFFLEGRVRFKTKKTQKLLISAWFCHCRALKLLGPVGSVGRSSAVSCHQESFIELQDKLHQNICRRRTLAAGQSMRGLSMLVSTCGPLNKKDYPLVNIQKSMENGH